jgi:DNA-binding response OmpR family regulator
MDPSPKITVLVVEDEALIAENLRLTLEDLGYAVPATCYTYAEARQAFAQHQPDLVLLDINLGSAHPPHNGLALAQQLRDQPQGPPFIFLTAYNDLDTIRQATRLQPSGYLIKPVNGASLFAAIQTALERHYTQPPVSAPAPGVALAAGPWPPTELPDYFFVKLGGRTHKLLWAEVSAIEAGKNYVTLRTAAFKTGYPLRGSMAYVLDNLVPVALREQFLRVNRSTCLNAAYIVAYDDEVVYCGAEPYENGQTAQHQLHALAL